MANLKEFEIPISSTALYILTETDETKFRREDVDLNESVPLTDTIIVNTPLVKTIKRKPGATRK